MSEGQMGEKQRSERLVRLRLKDGSAIDMHREEQGIKICLEEQCVSLPDATGGQAAELFALLEAISEDVEFPEDLEPAEEERKGENIASGEPDGSG